VPAEAGWVALRDHTALYSLKCCSLTVATGQTAPVPLGCRLLCWPAAAAAPLPRRSGVGAAATTPACGPAQHYYHGCLWQDAPCSFCMQLWNLR
jgi:hypothetical protein